MNEPAKFREWTLASTVGPSITFSGELIYSIASTKSRTTWDAFVSRYRWHQISVFKTRDNDFVLFITLNSSLNEEITHRMAFRIPAPVHIGLKVNEYFTVMLPQVIAALASKGRAKRADCDFLVKQFQAIVTRMMLDRPDFGARM